MRIKMRRLKNLPVFDQMSARVVGRVERAVVGEDFKLAYVIIARNEGGYGVLKSHDFSLGPDALAIKDQRRIKPYLAGEELSICKRKLGDIIFDHSGRELGVISDFILSTGGAEVQGVEVSSGAIHDILAGRDEIPLEQIEWKSRVAAMTNRKGNGGLV